MSILSILLSWVSDLTDPMKGYRSVAMDLNGVHSDAMQTFRQYIYQLDPNQALQQNTIISGDFANAIQQSASDFLQTDIDISAFESQYNALLQIADDLEAAVSGIEGSVEITALALEGDSVLLEITASVDVAAVAEAGANPIADIAGFILTLVAGAIVIDELKNLANDIYNDVQRLKMDLHNLALATYPPTPPEPKHVAIKPPDWKSKKLDANQQIAYNALLNKYKYLAGNDPAKLKQLENSLESFLKMGLNQADIEKIMGNLTVPGNNLTNDQILTFLNGIVTNDGYNTNAPSADKIKHFFWLASRKNAQFPLNQIVSEYSSIAAIPGSSRLLTLLIVTSDNESKNSYRGYQFELKWTAAHHDQIARIEDIAQATNKNGQPIQGNSQAADVVFKSGFFTKGAVVDTKSYTWIKYDVNGEPIQKTQKDINITALIDQIKRDKTNYPGYPLVYVFDSSPGRGNPPKWVIQKLTAAGATVMTSPPDKVLGVSQPQEPPDNSNNSRPPQLPPGGRTPPQLPPGGKKPPQLPPGGTPPPQLPSGN